MKSKFKIAAPCGLICDECDWFNGKKGNKCPGCLVNNGKPFWGQCEVFMCSKMKEVEHCGACKEFPCDTIIDAFDPNNKRGREEAIFRIGHLTIRNKIGTKEWLKRRSEEQLPKFTHEEE